MYLISVYLYRKYMKYLTPSPASEQLSQRGVTEDLCSALKWLGALQAASEQQEAGGEGVGLRDWALQVVAVVDRLKRSLSDRAHHVINWLQVRGPGPVSLAP